MLSALEKRLKPPFDIIIASCVICILALGINQSKATPPVEYLHTVYQNVELFARPSHNQKYSNLTTSSNTSESNPYETSYSLINEWKLDSALSNTSHTHDNNRVDLDLTSYAWKRMKENYNIYSRIKAAQYRQTIDLIFMESNVSDRCQGAIRRWLDELADSEYWATVMWNSWGNFPPSGLFEGSLVDLGSYRGCLGVQDNEIIGQTQYCLLDFQPLVPTRPRFHSIFKKILNVDSNNQMARGDFDLETMKKLGQFDKPASEVVSHGFSSQKFKNNPISVKENFNSTIAKTPRINTIAEFTKRAQFFYYTKMRLGSCWPTKCSIKDVESIAQTVGIRATLQAGKPFCTSKSENKSVKINKYQWVSIIVLSTLGLATLLASLLDILKGIFMFYELEVLLAKLEGIDMYLEVCSLQRNFGKLFSVSSSSMTSTTTAMTDGKLQLPSHRQLSCVHGLKFLTMIWVIYGHTLLNTDYYSFTHAFRIIDTDLANFFILPTLITNFSVDTFFVISGLLSAYILFSLNIRFNPILYTVARYVRLTPQMAIVILLFFLLPLIGDGPLFRQGTEIHVEKCFKNFWINLLHLQCYLDRKNLCIIPSWWISIEMTFHFMSLIIIYMLMKKPKWGMLLNLAITSGMTLIGAYIHYMNGFAIQYLPSIPQKYEVEFEQTHWFFHRPYPHTASYFMGFALGYALAKNSIKSLSRIQLHFGWLACCLGFFIPMYGTYYWNQGAPYSQLEATLYYNLCQILWPFSINWIILACSLGYGGPIDAILSTKVFVPLARITYMTYLSHIFIVYYYAASVQQTYEPSPLNLLSNCINNIVLSLLLGGLLTLIYEAPILNLQKMLLGKKYKRVDTTVLTPVKTSVRNTSLTIESEKSSCGCNRKY